jgi:hypothetical protein
LVEGWIGDENDFAGIGDRDESCSRIWKAADDAFGINGTGEFIEIHVWDREVDSHGAATKEGLRITRI